MTAEVHNLFPTGGDADDLIRKSVRAFMAYREMNVEQLAPLTEMSVATMYRKLAGKGASQAFKAGEVASIAHALQVDVGQLYGGIARPWGPPDGPRGPVGNNSHMGLRVGIPSPIQHLLAAVA